LQKLRSIREREREMALLGHIWNKSEFSPAGYIGILEDKGNS